MAEQKRISLGEQVSNKMSTWILVLIIMVTAGIFFVSYLLSKQMFNQQVSIWNTVTPQYTLSNLIDSDHFSIRKEIKVLESTGLFSSFLITDNQKRAIAQFGEKSIDDFVLIPIRDEGSVIWGYYSYETNFLRFISPFLISGAIFSGLVLLIYFIIRWRIKSGLDKEFLSFNHFLNDIEIITNKINEIYSEDNSLFDFKIESARNMEQEIINRTVARLINEIRKANKSLREAIFEAEQKRFQDELTKTALQVAHDIGSPLAVLETIVQSSSLTMPENSRILVRNAASRMRDISNSLLKKVKRDHISEGLFIQQHMSSLVNLIIQEKKIQYQDKNGINIQFDYSNLSFGLFSFLKVTEFSRILSNIINNSVEAIENNGSIKISLSVLDEFIVIATHDNGRGIPLEILSKLGTFGISFGKTKGMGIGLYHAKNTIESWGGLIEISSALNVGTLVKILLPKAQPPAWFVPALYVADHQEIVIIDDDQTIHDVWASRFNEFKDKVNAINLKHFYSPEDFLAWMEYRVETNASTIYLCDYEFIGSNQTGIDIITNLKINYLSILVTSRFNCDDLISICEASGIKLIPKDMASYVPIIKM